MDDELEDCHFSEHSDRNTKQEKFSKIANSPNKSMITVEEACTKTAYGVRDEMRKVNNKALEEDNQQIIEHQKVVIIEDEEEKY